MENHLENIDAYFSGNLNAEERKVFETKIAEDKNFAEQVAFYLSAHEVAKEEVAKEKKEWFEQLAAAQNTSQAPVRHISSVRKLVYRLSAAASIVGAIFLSWFLFLQNAVSPAELANNYIEKDLKIERKMGAWDNMQSATDLYDKGQFDLAAEKFEQIAQKDSTNTEAIINAGVAFLRSNNYEKALSYFQQLEKYELVSNPAVFYQALTLMKRNQPNDKQLAKQLLDRVSKRNLGGKELADKWLKKF